MRTIPFRLPRALIGASVLAALALLATASSAQAAAPVCTDVNYTVASNQNLFVPIDGPCTDSDGPSPMQGQTVTGPNQGGTIGPGPNGGGTYRSALNFVGTETFTYRAFDGAETSNTVTVTVEVTPAPPNDPPVCTDASYTVESNQQLFLPVVGPCTDGDGPSPLQAVPVSGPMAGATIGPGPNGGANYRSAPNFVGTDTLTFRASDGASQSNVATATINVIPEQPNDAPECPTGTLFVPEGGQAEIFGNCTDTERDPISYACCFPPPSGGSYEFIFSPIGLRYTPFVGTTTDFFTYRANDARHPPVDVTVPIEVVPPSQRVFESAAGASPAEPFVAQITTTQPGPVTIDARQVTATAPTGYTLLNQEFDIKAPPAANADNPLRLVFEIDGSEAPTPNIVVFRNETSVPPCTGAPGVAAPNPCVVRPAEDLGGGDLRFTVLTTNASLWNFGLSLPPSGADDCKKDKWKAFGTFKNQGDCVSFVATRGKNGPAGR